jgi:hypothetical protein
MSYQIRYNSHGCMKICKNNIHKLSLKITQHENDGCVGCNWYECEYINGVKGVSKLINGSIISHFSNNTIKSYYTTCTNNSNTEFFIKSDSSGYTIYNIGIKNDGVGNCHYYLHLCSAISKPEKIVPLVNGEPPEYFDRDHLYSININPNHTSNVC